MKGENIFRFFGLRSAAPQKFTGKDRLVFDPYELLENKTDLFRKVSGGTAAEILNAARAFRRSSGFADNASGFDADLSPLATWFRESRKTGAEQALASGEFLALTGKNGLPAELYGHLADSLLTIALLGDSRAKQSDELLMLLRLFYLRFSGITPAEKTESLGSFVSRLVPAFPKIELAAPVKKTAAPLRKPPATASPESYMQELERAHQEISSLVSTASPVVQRNKSASGKSSSRPAARAGESLASALSASPLALRLNAARLTAPVKTLLSRIRADISAMSPLEILAALEREMERSAAALVASPKGMLRLGNTVVDTARLYYSGTLAAEPAPPCSFVAGIGDLLLIRQELKGYRLGEIAHVENVLKGETRERNHRRLNRLTEDFFTVSEKEKTSERDLETTERNEMQSQISSAVSTELGLDLGVQVSGSYGPTVSFDSQLNSSFSSTTEETQQKAVDFSRSVTEKTSEKIRELSRREKRVTIVEETEETNQHRFQNGQENNITGVYRWLDKVFEARVLTYGQRMIFDFVLPEPAAFYLYSQVQSPPEGALLVKPEAPLFNQQPLLPGNLSCTNYQVYISQYGVTGVPEPPPQFISISFFDKQDGSAKDDYSRSAKLQIPDHYAAYAASVANDASLASTGNPHARVYVGDGVFTVVGGWQYAGFVNRREKEIALAVHCRNVFNFSLGVDVYCELTKEGLRAWQQKVYDAIMEAYRSQLADYEEKLATISIQASKAAASGGDEQANALLVQEELRKISIQLLTNHGSPGLDSFQAGDPPLIDTGKTCANGAVIRFFENAFEWNNMAYVLYPYFWGRKVRWADAIQLQGSDSRFTAFLKAGAARVQLAVRPGFERVVVHFIQFGSIWEGNDPPLMNDDTYLPIVQEIAENLGALDGGIPYPEDSDSWEISLPTSLVYLQAQVPSFEDPLNI